MVACCKMTHLLLALRMPVLEATSAESTEVGRAPPLTRMPAQEVLAHLSGEGEGLFLEGYEITHLLLALTMPVLEAKSAESTEVERAPPTSPNACLRAACTTFCRRCKFSSGPGPSKSLHTRKCLYQVTVAPPHHTCLPV
jgi:hypothetical protein